MNVVAFVSDPEKEWTPLEGKMVEERSHDDIVEAYKGWEPEIIQLLQVNLMRLMLIHCSTQI